MSACLLLLLTSTPACRVNCSPTALTWRRPAAGVEAGEGARRASPAAALQARQPLHLAAHYWRREALRRRPAAAARRGGAAGALAVAQAQRHAYHPAAAGRHFQRARTHVGRHFQVAAWGADGEADASGRAAAPLLKGDAHNGRPGAVIVAPERLYAPAAGCLICREVWICLCWRCGRRSRRVSSSPEASDALAAVRSPSEEPAAAAAALMGPSNTHQAMAAAAAAPAAGMRPQGRATTLPCCHQLLLPDKVDGAARLPDEC